MHRLLSLLFLAGTVLPPSALADPAGNVLTLRSLDEAANRAVVEIDGSFNTLSISQTALEGTSRPNTMTVSLSGDRNGGGAPQTLLSASPFEGLSWGSLVQSGEGNGMSVSVAGSDNLFAAVQSGDANSLTASMVGDRNQALVAQFGTSNVAAFSQVGHGNIVSITQRSW